MHRHENNVAITEDRTVGRGMRLRKPAGRHVTPSNYHGIKYNFQIPFTSARGVKIAESQRTVLAPTYSLAPGAMPGGWTQTMGLAHDFRVLR
jgi:hypothetical protein